MFDAPDPAEDWGLHYCDHAGPCDWFEFTRGAKLCPDGSCIQPALGGWPARASAAPRDFRARP
eukprot:2621547-Pyramimonas_sp.AAC.1